MLLPTFTTTANPAQATAITHTDGPLLIIAGPGSGKTFTLVERIVYLITERDVAPEQILVVTFTDKAAQELTTRIANRLAEIDVAINLNEMYLGTFHRICLRWLDDYREFTRLKRNFIMMDPFDQQFFLYRRLRDYDEIPAMADLIGPPNAGAWGRSAKLLFWLNKIGEEDLAPDALIDAPDALVRVLGQAYDLYQRQIDEENALDFSTIQVEALKLLRTYPQVHDELRDRIAYIMVDEYQDTNTIQERIIRQLAPGDAPNLCVVGDDDQGLYRFRGATIRNILQFADNFPPGLCTQVKLTVNYRSHPNIIDFYNRWIADQDTPWTVDGQTFRYPKTIVPPDDARFPDMPTAVTLSAPTTAGWYQEVLDLLHTLRDRGQLSDWNQVAFLFHSVKNWRAVGLAEYLEENGIPVYAPRANQFFDREEIRLMIGALIFLFPQLPEVRQWKAGAHLDIWDYYDQHCFAPFAAQLRKPENADLLRWCVIHSRAHNPMARNMDYAFSGLFYELLQFPLFSRYLEEDLLKSGLLDSRAMRNLAIFSQLLGKYEYLHHISVLTPEYLDRSLRDLFNHFLRFLVDGGIDEYEDEAEYVPSGSVSFLTIHQSKGLEFPVVFVGSMQTGPRKSYSDLDELLETGYLARPPFEPLEKTKFYDFRRLFYTAFSRAQNLLVLTTEENRGKGRSIPSKWFVDYFDSLPTWRDPAFRPEALPLDRVKAVNLKRDYAFTSHITVYENCAEQYRFFRALDFAPVRGGPILFGSLVHQTIEDIHKCVLRGQEERLSEHQIGAWFDVNYAYLTKRDRVYLTAPQKAIALRDVLRYYTRNNDDWSRIKEAEVDVSLVKQDYILSGAIDLIRGEGDTVEIVDFKSERKPDINDPSERQRIDRYRRQLEVYAHIIEERTGQDVSKTHLYYTREEDGLPTITWDKEHRSTAATIAALDQIVHRIEANDFRIPERPVRLCRECDLRSYCDVSK